MRKQVIDNILYELDRQKNIHANIVKKHTKKTIQQYHKGVANGFELSIRTCLDKAHIIDLRPKHKSMLQE